MHCKPIKALTLRTKNDTFRSSLKEKFLSDESAVLNQLLWFELGLVCVAWLNMNNECGMNFHTLFSSVSNLDTDMKDLSDVTRFA